MLTVAEDTAEWPGRTPRNAGLQEHSDSRGRYEKWGWEPEVLSACRCNGPPALTHLSSLITGKKNMYPKISHL